MNKSTGSDINKNGIEVGSCGVRFRENIGWWAYGTGVAEPRYSQAKSIDISLDIDYN